MALLRKLPEFSTCAIRLNSLGDLSPDSIPDLERLPVFQPELNRQLFIRVLFVRANVFSVEKVPVPLAVRFNPRTPVRQLHAM
jgi:hypothetical protein